MSGLNPAPEVSTAEAESDPLLGRVLNDRYRILEAVGRGGMGRVYKALQAPLDRVVALKVLGAGHDRDPNFYKRFFLEASVTAKLTHPNTITLYDYGRTDDGVFFIAMEFLDGRTLSQAMQADGPLAQDRVIHIAQQVCRSLREAHALGIIHRDLKPANVMLLKQQDDHDFVKVLDFGLVKFFSGGETIENDITNSGTFMGSPHYIAPEQARNQGPDQRCDIYSLGVLLYHMLSGQVPFTAPAPVDIILKHLHEPPVPLGELRKDLSILPELEQIVLRCMAKAREDRFQSMDELLAQLKTVRALLSGISGPHSLPPAPEAMPPAALVVVPAAVVQTPNTPQPGLRTPSQPMSAMRSTPARGTPHLTRPPPPPPEAMLEEEPAQLQPEGAAAPETEALPTKWQSSPAGVWMARNGPLLRVIAAPALIVLAGIATAAYVLRSPSPHAPSVLPAAPSPVAAPTPAAPPAEPSGPQAPAPAPQPAYPASFAGTTLVMVTSTPSGAEVHDAADRFVGITPFDLRVPSNKPLVLTFRHNGFRPVSLNKKIEGERMSLNVTLKSAKTDPYDSSSVRKNIGYKDDPY